MAGHVGRTEPFRRSIGGYKIEYPEGRSVHIECRFFGPFREAVGEKTVHHETSADTVGGLLAELEAAFPDLGGRLLDEETGLAGRTVVTKDTTDVTHLDGLETPLEPESVIRLVPSVYGG